MSIIDSGIRADVFRKRIEDKNTLAATGSIYVGTGKMEEYEITKQVEGKQAVTEIVKIY